MADLLRHLVIKFDKARRQVVARRQARQGRAGLAALPQIFLPRMFHVSARCHRRQPRQGDLPARRGHMLRICGALIFLAPAMLLPAPAPALVELKIGPNPVPLPAPRPATLTFDAPRLCALIEEAAEEHALPPDFFARLIWQESRFDIAALSPVGAEGVAQFMPGTAAYRGLSNSWDPRMAIPESARFLADLRGQFGNLGLAAAAYNSGPDRVAGWLAKGGRLPLETINYVLSITSRPVEWFRDPGREVEEKPLEEGADFLDACGRMPVIATRVMGLGVRKPWGVQIAAGISQGAALRAFDRARAELSSTIGGVQPILVRSRLVAGRTAWSARVGADSRAEALALCRRISAAGRACVVRQN